MGTEHLLSIIIDIIMIYTRHSIIRPRKSITYTHTQDIEAVCAPQRKRELADSASGDSRLEAAYVVQAWFESLVVQDQVCMIVPSFLLPLVRSRHWPPFMTAMRLSSV